MANNRIRLSAIRAGELRDTVAADDFADITDTFLATDSEGRTLSFVVEGARADTSEDRFTHRVDGSYGTLYYNSGTAGAYKYVANDADINALAAGASASDRFSVTANDGTVVSAAQTLTINIKGANDAPIFPTAPTDLTIAENDDRTGLVARDIGGPIIATDAEGDSIRYSLKAGSHAGFAIDAESNKIIYTGSGLDHETTPTIRLTIIASDGTATSEQTVTVRVTDVAEAPALAGISPHTIIDTAADDDFANIKGQFTVTNSGGRTFSYMVAKAVADTTESGFTHRVADTYGTLYYNSGTGTYQYVPNDADINALAAGASESDTFSVTASDTANIIFVAGKLTINIRGANDAPAPADINAGSHTDTSAGDEFADITGTFTATDADAGDSSFTFAVAGAVADTSEGSFTHSKTGTYGKLFYNSGTGAYKYVADNDAINALAASASESDTFSVTASNDGGATSTAKTLTISLTGANDTPVLADISPHTITDMAADDDFDDIEGTFTATDAERQTITYALDDPVTDRTETGFTHRADSTYGTFYYNSSTGAYKYVPNNAAINALAAGVSRSVSFLVTATDTENAASARKTLTINIRGANDAPIISPIATDLMIAENDAGNDGSAVTISTVRARDSEGTTIIYSLRDQPANFAIDRSTGVITYSGAALDYEALSETARTIMFTVIASDGTERSEQTISIRVTNVNEAPILADISPHMITDTAADDDFDDIEGTFSATDAERQTITYAVANAVADTNEAGFTHRVANTYGTLYYNSSSGAYKYVPNNAAINALAEGVSHPVSFSVTATDADNEVSTAKPLTINIAGATEWVFDDIPSGTYTDTSANDNFADIDGTFSAMDSLGSSFQFSVIVHITHLDRTISSQAFLLGPTSIFRDMGFTHFSFGLYGDLYYNQGTGRYRYDPNNSKINPLIGEFSENFSVTATGGGRSQTNPFAIDITAVAEAPIFNDVTIFLFENGTPRRAGLDKGFLIDLTTAVTDTDSEPDDLRFTFTTAVPTGLRDDGRMGRLFSIDDGQLFYDGADLDFEANAASWTLNLRVTDRSGLQDTGRVIVKLADANDAPVIANNALAYNQGQQAIVLGATDLSSTDEDAADGAADLTYTITGTLPSAGKLQLLGDHDDDSATAETWADITATLNSFTQSQVNAGKLRYVPNDPDATDGASFTFTVADGGENGVGAVSGILNVAVREVQTVANPNRDNIIDLSAETAPQIVDAGDGLDTITTGPGNDQIIGGLGSDLIHLAGSGGQSGGADELVYTFSGGDVWAAYDGGDLITGFKRGEDKIVFRINAAETSARSLNAFLLATRGADEQALTLDDQIVVAPLFVYENNAFTVTGITFYFRNGGTYSDNKLAMGALDIEFDTAISWAEFMTLIAKEGDANIDYGSLVIKDITILPNLLGEGSLEFRLFLTSAPDAAGFATNIGATADMTESLDTLATPTPTALGHDIL